ncbi:MAG: molybdopterin-dependent oxidoreductase [Deltaproteobacteria bacterium]|nr:molybdopterin-dependent oxidoreductase [Deltaproteobacteria bacterium]
MEPEKRGLARSIAFNRRNFIKLLVGGAAGIHLSPLPWKLTDDIAIWTQNWPWVPEPPAGAYSHVTTICQLCPGGCGLLVRKVDSRAVKIEGRTDYPVNPGGVCPLGAGSLQLLYNENIRFTSPMKRVGPRGSGKYVPISWDEALGELGDRLLSLRSDRKPEALVALDGNRPGSSLSLLVERFLRAFGSPNYLRMPTMEETFQLANRLMMGYGGPVSYDLENANFILSFGCGLIEGWGAPGRMLNLWGLWHSPPLKGKVKIVQIESRASKTASKADRWLAPRPGTEAALALAIAHVMVREGLYHRSFVEKHTFGFHDWVDAEGKAHVGFRTILEQKYSPGIVAEITGLRARDIVSLAKDFARSKRAIALAGKGKGGLNGSLYEFMAVQCLNALKGNINQPGGVLIHDTRPFFALPDFEPDHIAKEGLEKEPVDRAGTRDFPFGESLIHNLAQAVIESDSPPVETLLLFSANPIHDTPGCKTLLSAMKRIPYIVSFSPFRDESSYMADLVVPDHTFLEKTNDVFWPSGLQYPLYGLARPAVGPLYDTRNTGDVILALAGMMGEAVARPFPWKNFEEFLKERARNIFEQGGGGLTRYDSNRPPWKTTGVGHYPKKRHESFEEFWKDIGAGGFWYRPRHGFGDWERIFDTPSGKFEFYGLRIERAVAEYPGKSLLANLNVTVEGDEAFMPHYEPLPSLSDEGYPLLLLPYEIINLSSGWVPNPPYLNKTLFDDELRKEDSFAEINPRTADHYGLKQGDRIIIESPDGKLRARVNLFEGAMPGVVYLPLGFGHWAYDAFIRDKGVNPLEIVSCLKDPLSGQTTWWNTKVRIRRA